MNINFDYVVEIECSDVKETIKKMKYKQSFPLLIAAALAVFGAHATVAAEVGPTQFLKSKDNALRPLLGSAKKNKKKILATIGEMMDFDALSKASLGAYWDKRSPAEQKEFSTTLRSLIEENLIKRLKDSKDNEIRYEDEKVNADKSEGSVTTIVKAGKSKRADEIEVVYKMKKNGGKWIVVDMVTDGVSLVGNYQSQFGKIINDEGFEALMKKMRDKLAEERGEKKPTPDEPKK